MKTTISIMAFAALMFLMFPFQFSYAAEPVYGWQLMSEQERTEHRTKMQSLKTREEWERYRLEHHKKMQQRAKQKGITLSEMPPPRGRGMGPGAGRGMAYGPDYGWQLMTEQERVEHRLKMQGLKTSEEREKYRLEHHKKMQARAKEQGVALPEVPPQGGRGMGRGPGRDMGYGPGGGRGMRPGGPGGRGMGPGGRGMAYGPDYGGQFMTEQERAEHRAKMQSLKTPQEREKYRLEHHKKMQARAKEQGITLPDMPPRGGRGMGPGSGRGMGPGGQGYGPDYAWGLMTEQERAEYRNKMQGLQKERDRYRLEQYKKMQARAKERGVTLPDMPLRGAQGMGAGPRPKVPERGPRGRGYGPGYAWQLMTEQERAEYRNKMQSLKTREEREQYRQEQYKKMQARAKEQGVTLPDMPAARGRGMGPGPGRGMGYGSGKGPGGMMGSGGGR